MKKNISTFLLIAFSTMLSAQIYVGKTCSISFLSKTEVEDIAAINSITKPILNTQTGDLQIRISIRNFVFDKPLMQEHFNETYLESEKFPYAFFKGKINEKIDYTKDGTHQVTVTGTFEIHGVTQTRTCSGTVTIKGKEISFSSKFKIKFADYKVEIPSLQKTVIPEETEVSIEATLEPYKKK
jgi:YceI-like domain